MDVVVTGNVERALVFVTQERDNVLHARVVAEMSRAEELTNTAR